MTNYGDFAIPTITGSVSNRTKEILAAVERTRTSSVQLRVDAGHKSTPLRTIIYPKSLTIKDLENKAAPRIRKHAIEYADQYLHKFYKTDPWTLRKINVTFLIRDVILNGEYHDVILADGSLDVRQTFVQNN